MEKGELEAIIASLSWKNPETSQKTILGHYIGNGIFINGNREQRENEVKLPSEQSSGVLNP